MRYLKVWNVVAWVRNLKDRSRGKHHEKRHHACEGGEVTHEHRVAVRVREGSLQLRFPGHLKKSEN